ncbi:hypothetical protein O6H91_10G045500 [Diphasiastrum complanatum]|uniref:Uncharacterized protein n=2 Tax=Diphasiastrum complanatum TaxID=34168 RepID=A0ACC2CGN6_DIPCM|nr:hypothetical protein O6H91_10G045500 [Diphasiastrum complanatum]KAJ7541088.1 hypothetical protein O6H91_10G045500 [Diphasiastrum complanatum]
MSQPQPLPNLHFRELDNEYLQNRSKEWLEAVLGERIDGSQGLADILADGNILYRISKVIKELIRDSGGEATFPKLLSWVAAIEGKQNSKYVPYSNVDSFLKICKRVGLLDVDLFTPDDVVEKKDTRRVCLCIRALSKKGRANKLELPDFDDMVYTFHMPSETVGGIRAHLEQSGNKPSCNNKIANSDDTSIEKSSKVLPLEISEEAPGSSAFLLNSGNGLQSTLPDEADLQTKPHQPEKNGKLSDEDTLKEVDEEICSRGDEAAQLCSVDNEDVISESVTIVSDLNLELSPASGDLSTPETQSLQEFEEGEESPYGCKSTDLESLAAKVPQCVQNELSESSALIKDQKDNAFICLNEEEVPEMQSKNTESLSQLLYSNKYDELAHTPARLGEAHQNQTKGMIGSTEKHVQNSEARRNGLWLPVVAVALAFIGSLLAMRSRGSTDFYEVKKGDTLSDISRRTGKTGWKELAELNPGIKNPDLIYPSSRLRLNG